MYIFLYRMIVSPANPASGLRF